MIRLQSIIGLAAILLSAACTPARAPSFEADALGCATMCESFRHHGCRAGQPSPRLGVTCEQRCAEQMATGSVKPPTECVGRATSPDAIRACGERCSQ